VTHGIASRATTTRAGTVADVPTAGRDARNAVAPGAFRPIIWRFIMRPFGIDILQPGHSTVTGDRQR
jgi:hypothetical protein